MARSVHLGDLIAMVEERRTEDDALASLEAAAGVSQELGDTADELVTHFVVIARAAGASWTQIGSVLGVSKQGAQQRFVNRATIGRLVRASRSGTRPRVAGGVRMGSVIRGPGQLERLFTRRARHSVHTAAVEARRLNRRVGTEHLLLGLLVDRENLAVQALELCGCPVDKMRALGDELAPGEEATADAGELTPSARRALERSLGEALRFGHDYIGTEHILLALANDDGLAGETLSGFGLTYDALRGAVTELLDRLREG